MTFDAIGIASTGMTVHRKWLDAISDNLANINTATPTNGPAFQARYVEVEENAGTQGVSVRGAVFGDPEGRLVYEPSNPVADADGYVRYPDIDLGSQMTSLILAQRGYEASAAVVDRARETYTAALQIGQR